MGEVIRVCFERRVRITSQNRFVEAARRCSVEAARQPDEIARTLERCAARYLRQAAEGGAS